MIVMKFGGTSVGSGERIRNVARIAQHVQDEKGVPPVVVVSAMSGVTDMLVRAARTAADGDRRSYGLLRDELQQRHEQAVMDCQIEEAISRPLNSEINTLLDWLETLCQSIYTLGELTPRGLDVVSGLGERISARITAATMMSMGIAAQSIEATEIIVTSSNFGDAKPLLDQTRERAKHLRELVSQGIVPVVTGFIGATEDGVPTTLGRGGSDYSATILGSCLDAEEVWVWTDVDGVMTADPRIVPGARTLKTISYGEAADLSFFGAKVLHPKTIQPVVDQDIPVRVLNSFKSEHPGTLICAEVTDEPLVKGITAIRNLSLVTIAGRGMQGVPGVAGRVFSALARSGASALMFTQSSSEQGICIVVPASDALAAQNSVEQELRFDMLRNDVASVKKTEGAAIVAIVGAGMRRVPGIAARVFAALADSEINILSIAQGGSDYNMSLVIKQDQVDEAVRAIHHQFEMNKE